MATDPLAQVRFQVGLRVAEIRDAGPRLSPLDLHAKMDAILSRVDGTFTGLTGHTIIKLEDGTTWKQANAGDRYRAQITDHPPVKVSHGTFGYKMRVVGTGEFYVDPVRK